MQIRSTFRGAMAVQLAAVIWAWTASVSAVAPSDVWTVTDASGGTFSADGSSVLLRTNGGFQLRRAADGRVEKTISLPSASLGYDAYAFSPNKEYVALTYRASGVTRIELFSLASGALARTINTGATRNARGIALSSNGLVAILERWAYNGGGNIWVYRVADGSFVVSKGRFVRSSNTVLTFSPDAKYLAIDDTAVVGEEGVRVLRTTDWAATSLARSAYQFSWAADSQSLWTARTSFETGQSLSEEIEVPSGELLTSTAIDTAQYQLGALTPDNRFFLAATAAGNEIVFLRTGDGGVALRLSASAGARPVKVSPTGTLFVYTVCSTSSCSARMARMPAL